MPKNEQRNRHQQNVHKSQTGANMIETKVPKTMVPWLPHDIFFNICCKVDGRQNHGNIVKKTDYCVMLTRFVTIEFTVELIATLLTLSNLELCLRALRSRRCSHNTRRLLGGVVWGCGDDTPQGSSITNKRCKRPPMVSPMFARVPQEGGRVQEGWESVC